MFETIIFTLSKIFWALAAPSHALVLLLVLSFFVAPLYKVIFRAFATFALVAVMLLPVGEWALLPLEACYADVLAPIKVDGIIVLGGAMNERLTEAHKTVSLHAGSARLTTMIKLMHQYPQAQVVFSGGPGTFSNKDFHEADYVKPFLTDLGLEASRLQLEKQSRNTYENALYAQPFYGKEKGQNWLLVTSAYHLPRALSLFRQVGVGTNFYPTASNYLTTGRFKVEIYFDLIANLGKLDTAAKEYIGLLFNVLSGRVDTLWPCQSAK